MTANSGKGSWRRLCVSAFSQRRHRYHRYLFRKQAINADILQLLFQSSVSRTVCREIGVPLEKLKCSAKVLFWQNLIISNSRCKVCEKWVFDFIKHVCRSQIQNVLVCCNIKKFEKRCSWVWRSANISRLKITSNKATSCHAQHGYSIYDAHVRTLTQEFPKLQDIYILGSDKLMYKISQWFSAQCLQNITPEISPQVVQR